MRIENGGVASRRSGKYISQLKKESVVENVDGKSGNCGGRENDPPERSACAFLSEWAQAFSAPVDFV
ncbi:MAG: hypothetical protein LBQ48_03515 [Oscillospiraceae bacterium]|nr:hypothetical protein [Oscillospiraceae bacterium]